MKRAATLILAFILTGCAAAPAVATHAPTVAPKAAYVAAMAAQFGDAPQNANERAELLLLGGALCDRFAVNGFDAYRDRMMALATDAEQQAGLDALLTITQTHLCPQNN